MHTTQHGVQQANQTRQLAQQLIQGDTARKPAISYDAAAGTAEHSNA